MNIFTFYLLGCYIMLLFFIWGGKSNGKLDGDELTLISICSLFSWGMMIFIIIIFIIAMILMAIEKIKEKFST